MKRRIQAGERRERYGDTVDNEKVAWPSSWVIVLSTASRVCEADCQEVDVNVCDS